MFEIFKKSRTTELKAPISGKIIPIEEVEDEVFSSKMMGEGVAFDFSSGTICSPVEGVIEMIPTTLHAIGIKAPNGLEVLIHVGLDTVDLGGEGFTSLVEQGQKVKIGTPLLKVNVKDLKEMGVVLTTPMIITNSSDFNIEKNYVTEVESGQTLVMKCTKK
ncbi:PTS glucose transporter subunit IIA [Enterococcus hulanensis]|uniref:PTS sugar transporter subunit IIA n=1 Tax=Enterococcus hulanensis TaxID=2559929 RepID=UPI001A8E628B|nr:PTS glucose transporter subunit IIA [Enterococcus hulanensis]MBO0458148.1 PTS glucose transporter subunit IIA [Enterococcus hulanensis]